MMGWKNSSSNNGHQVDDMSYCLNTKSACSPAVGSHVTSVAVALADTSPVGAVLIHIRASRVTVICEKDTMRYRYNGVSFAENPHNRHPIDRPNGRSMECHL